MVKHGNEVKILTDGTTNTDANREIGGVPVFRIDRKFILGSKQLQQYLNYDFDVINWHGSDVWSTYYAWRLDKKVKNKIIWTLHSGILSLNDLKNLSLKEYIYLYKFWNNIFNAIISRFCARKWISIPIIRGVITLSKRTAIKLTEYGIDANKITPIPSGVDIELFRPDFNFSYKNFCILYFGPFSPLRGVDTLLSSFKLVKKRMPSAKLIILERKFKKDGSSEFFRKDGVNVVAGILDLKELITYLNRASIIVLPFKFWPQVECPLTVLEAMAMGKPVITTPIGAIPEIIENWKNGVIVPPNNPKELAMTILELLNNPDECKRIGKNARIYIERFHDWDKITMDTLNVLSKA
jgi:glycosyltransferase involved in cell wall biosynthesis